MKKSLIMLVFALAVLFACMITLPSCYDDVTYVVKFDTDCDAELTPIEVAKNGKISEPNAISKDMYNFIGWYYGDDPWDFDTDTVKENMTLTAKWAPVEHSVVFVADGITVKTLAYTSETKELQGIPAVPEKNGYNGVWEGFTLSSSDITVNAIYTPITYSITYLNTFDCTNNNPISYTIESDPITLAELYRDDSIFGGWFDATGNRVLSIKKGSFGDISLTALWTDKYTVLFNSNGGSPIEEQMVCPGDKITYSANPTRTGYEFSGWYIGNTPVDLSTYTVNSNITLKAEWTPIEYNAFFYADGQLVDTVKFTINDSCLANVPSVPTKKGYTGAWGSYTLGTQDITVNAIYSKITYSITYLGLNGEAHSNPTSYDVTTNTITLSAPTNRQGYSFIGWINQDDEPVTKIHNGSAGDITLTAKWEILYYNANFYADDQLVDTVKFTINDSHLANVPSVPTKKGYTGAWESYTLGTQDITVNAEYTLIPLYTINYLNLNGATHSNPSTYTAFDEEIVFSAPTSEEKSFIGWFTESGEKIKSIPAGSTGDVVIIAKWTISYEEYLAMDSVEKRAYYDSFENGAKYFEWYNAAKKKYEDDQDREIITDQDKPQELP